MSPENKALVERVLANRDTMDGLQDPNDRRFRIANACIVIDAPQLATALVAESERADAAEAKLKVAIAAIESAEHGSNCRKIVWGQPHRSCTCFKARTLAQLNPEESK